MKALMNPCGKISALLFLIGLCVASGGIQAEPVELPIGPDLENRQNLEIPRHGQRKKTVRARFGPPNRIEGPVGEPPITEWHYQNFVVYLERNKVLHTVIKPNQRHNQSQR